MRHLRDIYATCVWRVRAVSWVTFSQLGYSQHAALLWAILAPLFIEVRLEKL